MSSIEQSPHSPETEALNDLQMAQKQAELGQQWAELYLNPEQTQDGELPKSAEIALRNPAAFLNNESPKNFPKDLQERWSELLDLADSVAAFAATKKIDWGEREVSGVEKLQSLVRDGNIDPNKRAMVAPIIEMSSKLFTESLDYAQKPDMFRYYAGNVRGGFGWLSRAKRS